MPERRMLLVEPADMLRRTVSLTARSLGMEAIDEAASLPQAQRLLRERRYSGAVIAIDSGGTLDLTLLDDVREGRTASDAAMPIAVLAVEADARFVEALRGRDVRRVILKPFRAKVLLETFAAMGAGDAAGPAS
ncbi:response regulator [Pseudoduganella sp. SL102]|uniref:response regulator n=1 Tax=Pseudoduganella sp. SL102 TaxID=2995154 RepID=UPI00248BDEC9|nr:response regulator [Pseudoduganella sp. SL102]WBS00944.1 response regulator [Pseudoduganella sp. SL102]